MVLEDVIKIRVPALYEIKNRNMNKIHLNLLSEELWEQVNMGDRIKKSISCASPLCHSQFVQILSRGGRIGK